MTSSAQCREGYVQFNSVRIYLTPATDALVLIGKQGYANQNIVVLIT